MSELRFDKNTQLIVDDNTPSAIRAAFEAVEAAKADSEAAVLEVAKAVERQDKISKYISATFPAPSFIDLFRQSTTYAADMKRIKGA